jgi:hypothetical protein
MFLDALLTCPCFLYVGILTWREELAVEEEKARILEKALARVSANLDMEQTKAEATRKEYLKKMATDTARAKHSQSSQDTGEEGSARLKGTRSRAA